jgi:hypothetical protein
MVMPDGLHGAAMNSGVGVGAAGQMGRKILMKLTFVMAVFKQVAVKMFSMGGGKGIRRVMDQLAQGVVVQQIPAVFPMQAQNNAAHIPLCVGIDLTMKPAASQGAFQIGGGLFVRLRASGQKGADTGLRNVC